MEQLSPPLHSGHPLLNLGEVQFEGVTSEMNQVGLKIQVVEVTKPLLSIRKICESGSRVVFEDSAEGSYIQDMQTGRKTKLHKNGGTYAVDLWVLTPREGVVQEVPRLDSVEFSSEGPPSLCDSSEDEARAQYSDDGSSESEDEVQTFRRHAPKSA